MADTAIRNEEEKKEYFDSPEVLDQKVEMLAQMIQASQHMVAFTGAGISTACGIPDYRSGFDTVLETGPGCWETLANKKKYEDSKKAAAAKSGKPKAAQAATKDQLRASIQKAYPSKTHMALVELTEKQHLKFIISQNVDGLHRKSGIPGSNLAELHGNTNLEICEECGREYLRDTRVRTAKKVHEHRTGRKCESPGCDGFLKDTIINFNEPLNSSVLELGQANAASADLCLAMGSSLRVSPANQMPLATAQNGGNLVLINLQATPIDQYATLVIHGKCDDVMVLLMKKLQYQIPAWQMRKRLEVSLVDEGTKVQFRGVDETRQPFVLYDQITIEGLGNKQNFPSQKQQQQPYKKTLPTEDCPESFTTNLKFFGHYKEKNLKLTIKMEELQAFGSIVYECVMDSQSGQWELVVMQDPDRNIVGAAEFTQSPRQ